MSLPLFLVDPATMGGAAAGAELVLDGAEGRHAATVRRITVRERIELGDGAGRRATCTVTAATPSGLVLRVDALREDPAPLIRLVVVQALAKGDRGEIAVELLTELGVDAIVAWQAARSIVAWRGERGDKALARWRSTAREAAKQSRRARVPDVTGPRSTRELGPLLSGAAFAGVLHETAQRPLAGVELPASGDVVLVVGPEGGVSDDELAAFAGAGAAAYRLGPTVMRTSTAGAAAAAVLLSRSASWSTAPLPDAPL